MVSIIVPAYNEEKLIANCLDALASQVTRKKFEVILVDNNSTDRTREIAAGYAKKLHLRIIPQKIKGRGAARYKGFLEAKGEIILSTDADAVTPSDWVERLTTELEKSDCVAISGIARIDDCDEYTNYLFNIFQPIFNRSYRLIIGHYWLSGFNFAIYRSAYKKSGGFNPTLNALEDNDLAFKVIKVGRIKFISSIPVTMSGRRFQKGPVKEIFTYITTFIGYVLRNRDGAVLSDIRE